VSSDGSFAPFRARPGLRSVYPGDKAKIHALGNIRHATVVDALSAAFFASKAETANGVAADLRVALSRLTGQGFGDRRQWKEWRKENRGRFRFE
jgi:hypothetical protein